MPFEGFTADAFRTLGQLKDAPHIETYRRVKETLKRYVDEPFKRYRDALVLTWVLPNQLPFETERNVFSRILKNDFGAGGSHSHKWMSFYRFGHTRIKDLQLGHSIHPDEFRISLYSGTNAPAIFRHVKNRMLYQKADFLMVLAAAFDEVPLALRMYDSKKAVLYEPYDKPDRLPEELLARACSLSVSWRLPAAEVVTYGPNLASAACDVMCALWPLYRFLLDDLVADG